MRLVVGWLLAHPANTATACRRNVEALASIHRSSSCDGWGDVVVEF